MAWIRPYLVIVNVTIAGIVESAVAADCASRLPKAASPHQPVAVMIARGDLAMEVGTERLSEAQEEILWLCETAMGQRAECIMLNKRPYITETIRFLAGILHRMDRHQFKKTARLSALTSWRGPQPLLR
mgnify:FL=1